MEINLLVETLEEAAVELVLLELQELVDHPLDQVELVLQHQLQHLPFKELVVAEVLGVMEVQDVMAVLVVAEKAAIQEEMQ
jgi:hypothetical protein